MEEKILEGLPYLISYPKEFCKDKKYPSVILFTGAFVGRGLTPFFYLYFIFSIFQECFFSFMLSSDTLDATEGITRWFWASFVALRSSW